MKRTGKIKKPPWAPEEIDCLREAIKKYNGDIDLIKPLFPKRTIAAILNVTKKHKLGTIHNTSVTRHTQNGYNSNPVTPTTRLLVLNYYNDDIRKGMTHDVAIKDISAALNRSKEQVEEILVALKRT